MVGNHAVGRVSGRRHKIFIRPLQAHVSGKRLELLPGDDLGRDCFVQEPQNGILLLRRPVAEPPGWGENGEPGGTSGDNAA